MSSGIYSTSKILQHPEALGRIARREHQPTPIMVDFMPMLACNQSCAFCAYGHRKEGDDRQGWKNMELMSDAAMPAEKMRECVASWAAMGVKAVELTGGGEPLIYPHVDELLRLMAATQIQLGLVTNGTALTEERADLLARCNWQWARVSIDAGCPEDYCATRRVPVSHWEKAWLAVGRLAERASVQRVGVGFVVDNTNYGGIVQAARMARDHGADNIRVTLAFSPNGLGLFDPGVLENARTQARLAAEELNGTPVAGGRKFQVHDLISERTSNLVSPRQDYQFCGMKEVRCVVGGDQQVYTCCSLAFNKKGWVGSIEHQSFAELWRSPGTRSFFACHDAREVCKVECLYEQRNKAILAAIDGVRAPHGMFV